MSTFLFDKIVYGPVQSRRLGVSLGINLSPLDGKRCSFNCIYCQCGLNEQRNTCRPAPSREDVKAALQQKLTEMKAEGRSPDRITFSGNGEPTMHPEFAGVIDDVIEIRNSVCQEAKIAVLSNSTMLFKEDVFQALCKADEILMKFDAATDELIEQMNQPVMHDFTAEKLIEQLCRFNGKLIIQTIFIQGEYNGVKIDNTGEKEVDLWIEALKKIRPTKVFIYPVHRETPVKTIQIVPEDTLQKIAEKVKKAGFSTSISK